MTVTLKQIADVVGVDASVVSRVLNNKTDNYNFTKKRIEQICKTSQKLGYIPNVSARVAQHDRPTALILYWASLVPSLLKAARKLKITIPDDLSIITFAGCISQHAGLSINAMIEPEEEMGIESVKMLATKIKNRKKILKSLSLKFSYFDTGSCKKIAKN